MDMVGHDYVSPECDVEFVSSPLTICLQGKLSALQRHELFAVASSERDEVQRMICVNEI